MATTTPGLRERKNQRTRDAIVRAALELSGEQGFEKTTVAQIAERADVSPRTVHAWFPFKEDIVLSGADLRVDLLATILATGEGTVLDRIRQWLEAVHLRDEGSDELERRRHRIVLSDPRLRAEYRNRQQVVEDLIAAAIVRDTDLPDNAVAARALAAAILTSLLAMQERFVKDQPAYRNDFAGTEQMLSAALNALPPPTDT